jgi:hypothetical protein
MNRTPRLGHLVLGALLVAVGTLWLIEAVSDVEVPWEVVLPIALVLVGTALVYGASTGAHGGLITLGVALTLLVVLSSVFEVLIDGRFEGGVGERNHAPTGVAETEYRLAVGQLTLDLTSAESPGRPIIVSVGLGQLTVTVPADAVVEVHAKVGLGEVTVFGRSNSGLGAEIDEVPAGPTFVIMAEVGMGQVEVRSR